MPFLLDLVSKVKNESALNTFATMQHDMIRIPIPFQGINESIMKLIQVQEEHQLEGDTMINKTPPKRKRGGIRPGDAIDLIGISGSGKSWILQQLALYTLKNQKAAHIIYIDLDDRVSSNEFIDTVERFHLFKPTEENTQYFIQFSLEHWLIQHADIHVLWIMLDGGLHDNEMMRSLKRLQKKWAFVLMTTTTGTINTIDKSLSSNWNYRFLVTPFHQQQMMELIWPMHMDTFAL